MAKSKLEGSRAPSPARAKEVPVKKAPVKEIPAGAPEGAKVSRQVVSTGQEQVQPAKAPEDAKIAVKAKVPAKIPESAGMSAKATPTTKEGSVKVKSVDKIGVKEKVIDLISNMTVLELSELVKEMEVKFGVSAGAGVMAVGQPQAPVKAEPVEEKTEFDIILKSYGENKIRVIKVVREITELGLKESKDVVDSAPKAIKEKISKEEADSIVKKLEAVGATCEVR